MAGQPNPNPNDLFEAYFKRADLDGDGQISGAEAVAFFQASGLPKHVLAQVWMHADQRKAGFLGKQEFYNALKLVTVAQSKRDLTPDIVKAALYGPASAKIPAPQINLAATPAPKVSTSSPQLPAVASALSQSVGLRPPQIPGGYASPRPQYMPSQQGQIMKPPQGMPPNNLHQPFPSQGMTQGAVSSAPLDPSSSLPTDLRGASLVGPTSQIPNRGISPSATQDGLGPTAPGLSPSIQPRPQVTSAQIPATHLKPRNAATDSNQEKTLDPEAGASSGNGFPSDSLFGDVFSATPAQTIQSTTPVTSSAHSSAVSSAVVPSTADPQSSVKIPTPQPATGGQSTASYNRQVAQGVAASSPISSVGSGSSVASQSATPWPKMTQSDIQKYIKVFMQVDSDRDGKITGEQARNLFLSWRLPREILKQVWDLSDQDNDSMLSLMEFCIALYLMERYREGRPLPTSLPKSVMSDETLLSAISHPTGSYGSGTWGPPTGSRQPQMTSGARPIPTAAAKPPRPPTASQVDERQPTQQKPKVPELEKHLVDQLSQEEQDSLSAKFQEAAQADKKVEELEKGISDSRQKIDFYRAKMQELILYKSRCDNRLNEVSARVSSDKREVEALAKKYEEKYKQAGDVASKLTIEEATFRDIQESKLDLYRAIVKLEAEGTSDKVLKERAESIQASLEELVKNVNERCKQYGLRSKPTSLVELPFGWQPGVQEGAADWDEDWDKFEDEGFTFVKELTLDVQNVIASPKQRLPMAQKESASTEGGLSNAEVNQEKLQSPREKTPVKESVPHKGENGETGSRHDSPSGRTLEESESHEHQDSPFNENTVADCSPRDKQIHSGAGHAESAVPADKNVDMPEWGKFDSRFDTESVWGFDSASGKDQDHDKLGENSLLGFGDFGLNPIRTGSLKTDNMGKSTSIFADSVPSTPAYYQGTGSFSFDSVPSTPAYNQGMGPFNFDSVPSTPAYNQGKSSFNFDSVPSTPAYNQGNSSYNFADSVPSTPAYNFGNSDNAFDSFSRFDSFNTRDGGLFQSPRHSLSRFDSIRSSGGSEQNFGFPPSFDSFRESRDADQSRGFSTFDSFGDSDPNHEFSRFDSFRETDQSHGFTSRFDSFRESTDSSPAHGFSRFDSFKDNDSGFSHGPNDSFPRFDSFRRDSDISQGFTSFDDNDPFGLSGPFKSSGETPRKSTDNWRAF